MEDLRYVFGQCGRDPRASDGARRPSVMSWPPRTSPILEININVNHDLSDTPRAWTLEPRMDIKSIALSLQSMMSSAKQKERPPDNNSTVVMSRGQKTRSMQWEFHDDKC